MSKKKKKVNKSSKQKKTAEPQRRSAVDEFLGGRWQPYFLIVFLAFVIYLQALTFDFVHFDDHKIIVQQHEQIESLSKIPEAFTDAFGNLYRPVLKISWIFDSQISGKSPGMYHFTNVILHIIASVLVFMTLLKFKFRRTPAVLLSFVFTVHPVLTEAVAWIPGRNDSLLAIFTLLSFISIINYFDTKKIQYIILHLSLFALAIFTKETAALLPLMIVLYAALIKKDKIFKIDNFIIFAGWLAIGIVWFLLRENALANTQTRDITGFEAFFANISAFPDMLGKIILPINMSGLAVTHTMHTAAGIVLILLLIVIPFLVKSNNKMVIFGAIWFLVFLLPGFFARMHIATDFFDYLEHRLYLPMFGMLMMLLGFLQGDRKNISTSARNILIALITLFSIITLAYSREYKDAETFWKAAIEDAPGRANFYSVLGKVYYDRNSYREAKEYWGKAVELTVNHDPDFYNNLAVVYKKLKEYDKAIDMAEKAIELDPDKPEYRYFLGKMLYDQKYYKEAQKHLEKHAEIKPDNIDTYIVLTGVYAKQEKFDKGIEACNKILAIDTTNFHAYNILGTFYMQKNDLEKAEKSLKKAVGIKPDHLRGYRQLIGINIRQGDFKQGRLYAVELAQKGGDLPQEIIEILNKNR